MGVEDKQGSAIGEISGVLHGQRQKLGNVELGVLETCAERAGISTDLDRLLACASGLCDKAGVEMPAGGRPAPASGLALVHPSPTGSIAWQDLLEEYDPFVREDLPLNGLLAPDVVAQINAEFDAPLKRLPWDKWDGLVVLGAAVVGIIADWFCAPLGNPLAKKLESYGTQLHDNRGVEQAFKNGVKNSPLAGKFPWLDGLINSPSGGLHNNLSIDYRRGGGDYGWEYHRGMSPGHDLFRFVNGIWQIKNGKFVGTRFEDGEAVLEVIGSNSKGVSYSGTGDWQTAAILYLLHVSADFFTKTSLPIPGSTFLREIPIREVRKFVADMYEGKVNGVRSEHGGVNLRHLVGQSVTPAVVSLIIWLYYLLRYRIGGWIAARRGQPHEEEAIKGLKLNEMMAAAHTAVMGVNIGRVIITHNPTSLNLAELMVCVKHLFGLALKTLRRRSPKAKFERNQLLLSEGWDRVEAFVSSPLDPSEVEWPSEPIYIGREAA